MTDAGPQWAKSLGKAARVYVDANLWIYYLEGKGELGKAARKAIQLLADNKASLVTNELAIAECLYKPARDGDQALLATYEALFALDIITKTRLTGELAGMAAMGGGALGLRLLDAIHWFAAMSASCDVLLTGDGRFRSRPGLGVVTLRT